MQLDFPIFIFIVFLSSVTVAVNFIQRIEVCEKKNDLWMQVSQSAMFVYT